MQQLRINFGATCSAVTQNGAPVIPAKTLPVPVCLAPLKQVHLLLSANCIIVCFDTPIFLAETLKDVVVGHAVVDYQHGW